MDKAELQNFILWFIPAAACSYLISASLLFSDNGVVSYGHRIDFLLTHANTFVCGVWLYIHSAKHGLNRWLWGLFGLGASLFAIVLYFGYVALNKRPNIHQ